MSRLAPIVASPSPVSKRSRRAFSLVELLVVMSILLILTSMLMPMLRMAQRATRKTMTQAVFQKVDTALHLFRSEVGTYPWQASYPTDAQLASGTAWSNNLYYNLGTMITAPNLAKLKADADTATNQYTYIVSGGDPGDPRWSWNETAASVQTFVRSDVRPGDARVGMGRDSTVATTPSLQLVPTAVVLNRLAIERARRAIYAGNPGITGVKMQPYTVANGQPWNGMTSWNDRSPSNSTIPLVAAPQSASPGGTPGWAHDYFTGLLEKRFIRGNTILDGYGQPLIYVCQVTEGVKAPTTMVLMRYYGARIDPMVYGLQRQGRTILQTTDPVSGAGVTLPADPLYLPNPANFRHSDRRFYAAPGFEGEFELWSAGYDGAFRWMRDDATNTDNLSLLPYDDNL